ncbi:MAG: sugar kinase, partial [Rhodococcus fascians]
RSPVWAQALSDITGQTQLVTEQAIGASYGDGLLAAIGVGEVPPETDWATVASEVPPNPAHRALYDDLYASWLQLYPATRDIVHAGAQLTR